MRTGLTSMTSLRAVPDRRFVNIFHDSHKYCMHRRKFVTKGGVVITVAGIVAIAALIVYIEAPPLWRNRERKSLILFSIMMVAATALAIGQALDVTYPNPLDGLAVIFKPVGAWLHNTLN